MRLEATDTLGIVFMNLMQARSNAASPLGH